MSDSLVSWYERELSLLWHGGKQFAKKNPALARELGLSIDRVDDPHVSRLVESFALLTARLSRQLSDESSGISSSLLEILYPLCLQPLPSASLFRIAPSRDQSSVAVLPRGTRFRAYLDEDRFCQFQSTRNLELCPFDITSSQIESRPFRREIKECHDVTRCQLCLELSMLDNTTIFSDLGDFSDLTVYFKGRNRLKSMMYDALCHDLCKLVLVDDSGQVETLTLENFTPIGFDSIECMLMTDECNFIDNQMMTELFSWPELFFGFRLKSIGDVLRCFSSPCVSIIFCLKNLHQELQENADHLKFQLGCAPVINLFEHIGEPIVVNHRQLDYPVIPDSHSANVIEIQSIREVLDITGEEPRKLPCLYGLKHRQKDHSCFWLYRPEDDDYEQCGHLEIVNTELQMNKPQTQLLSPTLLCNNGNQALELPAHPRIECVDNVSLQQEITMLLRPTARRKRRRNLQNRLDLLVHLSDNLISVLESKDPVNQIKNLMSLYRIHNSDASKAWLESIVALETRPLVAPVRIDGHQCFTQGSELIIELDPNIIRNYSLMMFVNLLDFLSAGFAGFHSFIQLVVKLKGLQGEFVRCSRHHGYQINL